MIDNANTSLTLSIAEVAELLGGGISTRSIERWSAAKQFPQPIRLGARRVWRRRDIELFVETGGIHAFRRAKAN